MLTKNKEVKVVATSRRSELRRVSKFGLVGALNTLLDFVIYNLLSSKVGLTLVQSNIISTTIAMIFSFMANRHVVFKKHGTPIIKQSISFLLVTAFGLYVLQTGAIKLLTDVWLYPMQVGILVAHTIGIRGHDEFLIKNGAKAIATVISLTWNYIMYKKVVFK